MLTLNSMSLLVFAVRTDGSASPASLSLAGLLETGDTTCDGIVMGGGEATGEPTLGGLIGSMMSRFELAGELRNRRGFELACWEKVPLDDE